MRSKWLLWAGIAAITTFGGAASADDPIDDTTFDGRSASCPGTLSTVLSGIEETDRGDPNGFGGAVLQLDELHARVCFNLVFYGIDPPTAAHIHQGRRGVAGPIVVTLFNTPFPRYSRYVEGCVDGVDSSLLASIRANPGAFYVNLHNFAYPNGAVRGQLGCTIEGL